MQLPAGTKVIILHTGETGSVVASIDEELALILLEESLEELPVAWEDLRAKDSHLPGQVTNKAIRLVFVPSEIPDQYQVYLSNEGKQDLLYEVAQFTRAGKGQVYRGQVEQQRAGYLGTFETDLLNEQCSYLVKGWAIQSRGTGPMLQKLVRLRPKRFAAPKSWSPTLGIEAVQLDAFSLTDTSATTDDIRQYTEDLLQDERQTESNRYFLDTGLNLNEVAEFNGVIDLHLESLVDDPSGIPKDQILFTQLEHFENFMSQAYRLGAERVFLIHGIGEGTLREAIHDRLKSKAYVRSFKNEFHPLYGNGATEVLLK